MNKKELNSLLSKAKRCRSYGDYADALALLHQVVENYPEPIYYYLLASTYYESGESEIAIQYADIALLKNPEYKEVYELKGMIYDNDKDYALAQQMCLKALKIDPEFINVRKLLIGMLAEQGRHENVIAECALFPEKYKFEAYKDKAPHFFVEFMFYETMLENSYIHLKQYQNVIQVVKEYIEVFRFYHNKENYSLADSDKLLYKLYYLLKDRDGMLMVKKKWKEYYKVNDEYIHSLEKDAEQGYLTTVNVENYKIDTKR